MKKIIPILLLIAIVLAGCEPYSADIKKLDSQNRLSFLVDIDDADYNSHWYLRTIDFANDTVTDLPLDGVYYGELVYGDSMQDLRVLQYAGEGAMYSLHKLSTDGQLSDGRFFVSDHTEKIPVDKYIKGNFYDTFGWFDGRLRTWEDYNCEVLSYAPDGRVIGTVVRDTGKKIKAYSYKDENGKMVDVERDMRGFTLGIEDAEGRWQPVLNFGEDNAVHIVSHAGWIDGENLLIIGSDADGKCAFYRVNTAAGQIEKVKTAKGKPVDSLTSDESCNSHIAISPDGRFAAYTAACDMILVTDFQTGRSVCVFHSAFNDKTDDAAIRCGDIRFWH